MKRYGLLIALQFIVFQAFTKTTFELANEYYLAEDYRKSSETYMAVVQSGVESPELYYNLGNSFFRLGDYPNAILYYEKALRLSPKDADIQMNIGIANTKIIDKFEEMPDIFFVRYWKIFAGFFSRDGWAIIFLSLVFASVLSLAWYVLAMSYGRKKLAFYVCFLFVIFSLTAFGAAFRQHREQTQPAGIIMRNKVDVSSSPQTTRIQFTINGGTKVDILDELGDSYRIRIADGRSGWVSKSYLSRI